MRGGGLQVYTGDFRRTLNETQIIGAIAADAGEVIEPVLEPVIEQVGGRLVAFGKQRLANPQRREDWPPVVL
jgi:hypothetical protein